MHAGQVTALLGHNGAGKTTLISMLTGMLPISGGSASIGSRSVEHDMAAIRHEIGVCPQHNILFPELTVTEHLIMFAAFKVRASAVPPPPQTQTR